MTEAIKCAVALWVVACAISVVGGYYSALSVVKYLHKKIDPNPKHPRKRLPALDWWLGGVERAIITTLVIWAPALVPVFVGGWVALKFAAHWRTMSAEDEEGQKKLAKQRLTFLIGSAVSICVAIGAGLLVNLLVDHPAIKIWAAQSN